MSETTKIEWANHTGGPWLICSMVSAGCTNCYAMQLMMTRLGPLVRKAYKAAGFEDWATRPIWGDKATRVLTKGFWEDARRINAQHAKAGTRGRWFPSMIDWLDKMPAGIIDQNGNKLDPIAVLADLLKLIHDTPNLDWLLLTKRPENFYKRVLEGWGFLNLSPEKVGGSNVLQWLVDWTRNNKPPSNAWIGTSVEDQQRADERIPELLKIPAKVRFLSVEPMLGPIDMRLTYSIGITQDANTIRANEIHWVIVGGESGPGARLCNIEWVRSIVAQCKAAGVPCFVKQLGSFPTTGEATPDAWPVGTRLVNNPSCVDYGLLELNHKKGGDPSEWPEDLRVRQFPKLASGLNYERLA